MRAHLLFKDRQEWGLKFGGVLAISMDCYQVTNSNLEFEKTFVFSWIAFDPENPERRVLMDQHRTKACHLHLGTREVLLQKIPRTLEDALVVFRNEVEKYFGELAEE